LMDRFGVDTLEAEAISQLPEPTQTWFRWGLGGFARAEQTYALLQQFKCYDRPMRHLDVGCGPGYLSTVYASRGHKSVGIDVGDLALAKLNKLDFPSADLEFKNLDSTSDEMVGLGSFDIVTVDNVIEHVDLPSILMGNLARIIASDGIVYLIVPNAFSIDLFSKDPRYRIFALSVLDKKDGDAIVGQLVAGSTEYEVNNCFSKYGYENYVEIFTRHGFEATLCNALGEEERREYIKNLCLVEPGSVKDFFAAELEKLVELVPPALGEKIRYVVALYVKEFDWDFRGGFRGTALSDWGSVEFLVKKYLMPSWFFVLKRSSHVERNL